MSASRVSALDRVLNQASDISAYKLGMTKGTRGGHFREVLSISSSNASTAVTDITHRFVLPKNGVLSGLMLRIVLKGAIGGAAAADTFEFANGYLGCRAINEVSLKTNSRTLLTATGQMLEMAIDKSPHKAHYQVLSGHGYANNAQYGGTIHGAPVTSDKHGFLAANRGAGYSASEVVLCIPILMSPTEAFQRDGKYHSNLDLSFVETVALEVKLNGITKYMRAEAAGAATLPTAVECTLTCVSSCPFQRNEIVKSNYTSGKSCQLLWDKVSLIGSSESITPAGGAISRKSGSIKINATDLCKSLDLVVQNDDPFIRRTARIESVRFVASGRTIASMSWEDSKFAALCGGVLESAPMAYTQTDTGVDVSGMVAYSNIANGIRIQFADSPHSNQTSGALALSGLSSMSLEFTVIARSNAPFVVNCFSTASSIVSISSDSGTIVSSNSL